MAFPCSFTKKMGQLCLWTKTRFGYDDFSMYAYFLCPKCDNITCLHTCQDQIELHLKRWFFLPKSASSASRSVAIFLSVVQAYTQPYLFGRRIKLSIFQIRYDLSVTIYKISTSWKKKTLDGGPYSCCCIYKESRKKKTASKANTKPSTEYCSIRMLTILILCFVYMTILGKTKSITTMRIIMYEYDENFKHWLWVVRV